jgi:hypothetical protein
LVADQLIGPSREEILPDRLNGPSRASKVRTRTIELHDEWSRCTVRGSPRSAAGAFTPALPTPTRMYPTSAGHPTNLEGIRRRSNQLSINARRLARISPDPGMCEVSRPRHLTRCGSGLSRTEPPAGKELPGTPAESGHGSFQSRSRWGSASPARPFRRPIMNTHNQQREPEAWTWLGVVFVWVTVVLYGRFIWELTHS